MEEHMSRPYRLAAQLSKLFDLKNKIDTLLPVSMYYLNQYMDAERSSIFLFQHWDQKLTVFSSLDLKRDEISIPKSCGVAGWVFANQQPAVVNNAYEDTRFYKDVDDMTGFQTRNLVCAPLLNSDDQCLGTIQSMNRKSGDFSTDDLELLKLAAQMIALAIDNSRHYSELLVTNDARKKFIKQIFENGDNFSDER